MNRNISVGLFILFGIVNWSFQVEAQVSNSTIQEIDSIRQKMYVLLTEGKLEKIAEFYAPNATVEGFDGKISGYEAIRKYWAGLRGKGLDWIWDVHSYVGSNSEIFQTGLSHLTLGYDGIARSYTTAFSVAWVRQKDGRLRIAADRYFLVDQTQAPHCTVHCDSVEIYLAADTIFGLLFRPIVASEKKHPAILCLQGGGNAGLDNYTYEARLFAQNGLVALVCDKSGLGRSSGKNSWIDQSFVQKTQEYGHLLNWLRHQSIVDSTRVGVHGPSEGGRLAIELAATYPEKVQFVNAVSAPLETLKDNQLFAIDELYKNGAYSQSDIVRAQALFEEYFEAISLRTIPDNLTLRIIDMKKKYPKMYLPLDTGKLPRIPKPEDVLHALPGGWEAVKCPVFFQYGKYDALVNVRNSLRKIPPRPGFKIKVYEADHSINLPNGDTHGSYHIDKIRWVLEQVQR